MFGISSIKSIKNKACLTESVVFYEDLKTAIAEKSKNYGSRSLQDFSMPCGADKVFFIDLEGNIPQKIMNQTRMIRDSLDDSEGKNVFIFKDNKLMNVLAVEDIGATHPYYRCFSNRDSKMKTLIQSVDDKVLLEHISERKNTSFDCTNYNLPLEYSIEQKETDCDKIVSEIGLDIYKFFPSPEEAIKKCKESRNYFEIDREFLEKEDRTEMKLKIRNKKDKDFENVIYIERILKECINSLSDSDVEFIDTEGQSTDCTGTDCGIVRDDPLIVWFFDDILGEQYLEFSYEVDNQIKEKCLSLIDGLIIVGKINGAPPKITSNPITIAKQTLSYTYDVQATDPDSGDKIEYYIESAPNGVTMDKNSGLITWTPSSLGKFEVTIYVMDSKGLRDYQKFEINVINPSPPPIIKEIGTIPWIVNKPFWAYIDVSGGSKNTFSLTKAPNWLDIEKVNNKKARVYGTPTVIGRNTIIVKVEDESGQSDTENFGITVKEKKTYKIWCNTITEHDCSSTYDDECRKFDGGRKTGTCSNGEEEYICWNKRGYSACSTNPTCPSGEISEGGLVPC